MKYKIKTEIDCDAHNKEAIELHLQEIVKKICRKIGLQPKEWEASNELCEVLLSSDKFDETLALLQKYDSFYVAAEALKVKINPRYSWLRNLTKHK